VRWGVAERALSGQDVSGDGHLVCTRPGGGILFAVVDGLGHGGEAAAATTVALATLNTHVSEPIVRLLNYSHDALKRTRGAAISLASFDARHHSLTWLGVGNVEGVVLRDTFRVQQSIMLFPGVVGYQLPKLWAAETLLEPQDLLILFTDGISRDFLSEPNIGGSPEFIANKICNKYSKPTDDALVLVARFANAGT